MYYRVAIQTNTPPIWRWRSTALSSAPTVMRWLLYFYSIPRERLSVFSSDSREGLDEHLQRANGGLPFSSTPATQFVPVWNTPPQAYASEASGLPLTIGAATGFHEARAVFESAHRLLPASPLEQNRDALERGAGGDHDLPYQFSAPNWMPEVLAWANLLARVELGDLRAEVIAIA